MKIQGFTLAEVLTTLMVIGVVAAMTIPSLSQTHRKTEYAGKLKKYYSTMSNAIKMAEVEESTNVAYWDFSLTAEEFYQRYFSKHVKSIKNENKTIIDATHPNRYFTYFPDGTSASYAINNSYFLMSFDVNGNKLPNQNGVDQYYFTICNKYDDSSDFTCAEGRKGITFGVMQDIVMNNRTELVADCESFIYTCSWLIMQDGWQYKKDYPHKI